MSYIKRLYFLLSIYLNDNVFLILQFDKIILRSKNIEEEKTGWGLI